MKFNYKKPYPKYNNFWWIEFGGNLNTIFDAYDIQYELKRIAYGVWEYMKNNPDGRCKNYDLDWIGSLPGKRESTRYIGPHILNQNDVMSGGHFPDVIAYGGWTLDNHHPDALRRKGIFSIEHTTPGGVRKDHIAELQDILEDDDSMLPYRWRKPSELTISATTAEAIQPLRNGIDRKWDGEDNGVWIAPGDESITYRWKKPVTLTPGLRRSRPSSCSKGSAR